MPSDALQRSLRRRSLLRASFALAAGLLAPRLHACEYFGANLRITHPWSRATVKGASFADVCMKFDQVTLADRLVGVETAVAVSAQIGGLAASPAVDFCVPLGQETLLSEDGSFLRLVGLRHPLELGRSYPLTLVFERAGAVSTSLSIDFGGFRFG